jgi:hypothetical protein
VEETVHILVVAAVEAPLQITVLTPGQAVTVAEGQSAYGLGKKLNTKYTELIRILKNAN